MALISAAFVQLTAAVTRADALDRCAASITTSTRWTNANAALDCPANPDCNTTNGPYVWHSDVAHEDFLGATFQAANLPACAVITSVHVAAFCRYDSDCDGQNRKLRMRVNVPSISWSYEIEYGPFNSSDGDCHWRDWDITNLLAWDAARLNDLRLLVSRIAVVGEPRCGGSSWLRVKGFALHVEYYIAPPPVIVTQPTSTSACVGTSASLCIAANGVGPLSYQWYLDNNPWPGATGPCHAIGNVQPGHAGTYYCVVTSPCGSATSASVTLTVNTPPSITSQPVPANPCEGGSASICVAVGGTGPLSYQWQKNGVNIAGATASCYAVNNAQPGNAGNYRCVVTGACGTAISNAASLTVRPATRVVSGPTPASQTACELDSASFSLVASGDGTLSYNWRRNGVSLGAPDSRILNLTNIPLSWNGSTIDCVVTGGCGTAPSPGASLSVVPTLLVNGPNPSGATVRCEGGVVSWGVTPSRPNVSYQWYKDGVPIPGAIFPTYTISPVLPGSGGYYYCVITDGVCTATSLQALLKVRRHGDSNCDAYINNFDIDAFVIAISQGRTVWQSLFPCDFICANDMNGDGLVNNFDIDGFVAVLSAGEP